LESVAWSVNKLIKQLEQLIMIARGADLEDYEEI
jgi:hypothetical protein